MKIRAHKINIFNIDEGIHLKVGHDSLTRDLEQWQAREWSPG